HRFDSTVIGPAFIEVSKRYQGRPNEIPGLANKIIIGGAGVWGNHYMNAHPQLSKEDAINAVKYILSLTQQKTYEGLSAKGTMNINSSQKEPQGSYVLSASYTDLGNGVVPLTNAKELVLRSSKVEAENADAISNIERNKDGLGNIHNKSYFVLKSVDLKNIKQVTYRYASKDISAALEVHLNSPKGELLSALNYQTTGGWNKFREATTVIKDPGGKHDLYFVFRKDTEPDHDIFLLDWLEFKR
ncbi:MAG TPA: carbohydrate-binding protein, partial [Chitinophagaceae bacterium]